MELCKVQEKDHSYVQDLLVEAFPPNERKYLRKSHGRYKVKSYV